MATSKQESFFKDKNGKTVIFQSPNLPLIGWMIFEIVAYSIPGGRIADGLSSVGTALLFVWCYLEIYKGSSRFRQALGVFVMFLVVLGLFKY